MLVRLLFLFFLSINVFAVQKWHYKCGDDLCVKLLLKKELKKKSFSLSKPFRWVIDIPKSNLQHNLFSYTCNSGLCKRVRVSNLHNNIRVVVDFDYAFKYSVLQKRVKNNYEYNWRFVRKSKLKNKKDKPENLQNLLNLKNIIVVVDPGHGGKDPGAIGYRGLKEKKVVLSISKKIVNNLNKEFGFKAYLTRDRDFFLTLRQRVNKARNLNADCFLAVHADAHLNKRARGMSVYALSARGANKEASRWLSGKEKNDVIGGVNLSASSKILSRTLIDFQQRATAESSLLMGKYLVGKLSPRFRMHNSYVGKAAFVVLKSPDIASLLLETGFISNKKEAENLSNAHYQDSLALIVSKSIKDFYIKHPVKNSLLAANDGAYYVTIMPKDTLYKLSKKYHVPLSKLYLFNKGLKNKVLKVGDRVKIVRFNK